MEIDDVPNSHSAFMPDSSCGRNDNAAFEGEPDQESDECSVVSDLFDGVDLDMLPQE